MIRSGATPSSTPTRGSAASWPALAGTLGATLLLALAAWLSLGVGAADLGVRDLFSPTPEQWNVLVVSRIPRMLAVLLAGASLAVAGLIMQRLTQNRFVSPSTSGTTEAAVLGVLAATLLIPGESLLVRMLAAIVTALIGTAGFLQLVARLRHSDPIAVALVGLMYGGVISAITVFIAFQRDMIQFLDIWTTGSFSGVLKGSYEPIFIVLAVGAVGYLYADRFTVVGLGKDMATNLGVNHALLLRIGLVIVSVMAAVVVVVVGAIPFLGLVVPNVVSMFLGDNIRRTLPITALAGAGFVLACDVAGRLVIHPYEIPASTIAGVIGGGVFVLMILRAAQRGAQ